MIKIDNVNFEAWPPLNITEKIYISPHFTMQEATKSNAAVVAAANNWPMSQQLINNIVLIARTVLEPIRSYYDIPFSPQSWYRSTEVNRIVGGVPTSFHTTGLAVDIELPGINNKELAIQASQLIDYDKIILENHVAVLYNSGWVHIQITNNGTNRRQLLSYSAGVYTTGV